MREATQTHAALLAALRGADRLVLDCAGVTEADLSFIQMLLAARRGAGATGRGFALRHPPDGALLDALRRGGFLHPTDLNPPTDPALWTADGAHA